MNSGEIMNSTDLTLVIFSVILIIIAIFLFILLKIFGKKKENKTPETNSVNKNEPPVMSFVSLPESAKGSEKQLNTEFIKEEMKPRPEMLPVEENANLKLEDTLAENEVEKTVHNVSGKKVNRNNRQARKKTEKIDERTLNKETKQEEILVEKKPVTKVGKKNSKKEVAKPAIKESEEKSPEKESIKKVSRKKKVPPNVTENQEN
jgi:hypothetical protein